MDLRWLRQLVQAYAKRNHVTIRLMPDCASCQRPPAERYPHSHPWEAWVVFVYHTPKAEGLLRKVLDGVYRVP